MVGTVLTEKLKKEGFCNLILRTKEELDLLDQDAVREFFLTEKPDYVFLLAARVGSSKVNMTYPAEFLYENVMMQYNVIWSAHLAHVEKLLFTASASAYPGICAQPIKEESLLTGPLDPVLESYSFSKIAGVMLCQKIFTEFGQKFISCLPSNIYGIHDHFDIESGHVVPSLINKIHNAKINNELSIKIWGTGENKREFMYVEDFAEALMFLMNSYEKNKPINVGTGIATSVLELVETVKEVIGYSGGITHDTSAPEGVPMRVLDVSKLHSLGFVSRTSLSEGVFKSYKFYLESMVRSNT